VVTVDRHANPGMSGAVNGSGTGAPRRDRRELAELRNEFATVRVTLDQRGNGPRLLVEDLESGAEILLSPLELASLCLAGAEDRVNWLRVGHYRDERP
jgi:hypothetical protein